MTQRIIIPAGQSQDLLYINHPELDITIEQQTQSKVRIHVLHLYAPLQQSNPCARVINKVTVQQMGEGCETEIYGLGFLQQQEDVEIETHVQHLVGQGSSTQLVKFVLDDEAKGHFYGHLLIAAHAQQTSARQTNRNILLSPKALMATRPQLEIYADDVQASHGATTGQLDDTALFYMQQRGIGKEQARRLLIGAFVKDVLQTIGDEAQRTMLMDAIDGVIE